MKLNSDILNLLKKYAKGELSDAERSALEAMLREQPALREEVELTRGLLRVTEKAERQRLLSLIQQVEARGSNPALFQTLKEQIINGLERLAETFFPRRRYRSLGWATVMVLLLAAVGVWWIIRQPGALADFQRTAYVPPAIPEALRRGAATAFSTAVREYESGNYRQSIAVLEEISSADSLYLMSLFLQGHGYYHLGRYEEAQIHFDAVASRGAGTGYVLPNPDNVAWTRIAALLCQYNSEKGEAKKRELQTAVQQFLDTAESRSDVYYQKAVELRALLSK